MNLDARALWLTTFLIASIALARTAAALEPQETDRVARLNVERMAMPELEQGFWRCDYRATVAGLDATPVELCTRLTEALKQRKFGGSFDRMLEWWRQKKPAEHGKMARQP